MIGFASSSEEENPLNLRVKDSTVIARQGSENISLAEIKDCRELVFENVTLKNFNDPRVICPKDCNVSIQHTNELRVERVE